jgi:hypothetical protein
MESSLQPKPKDVDEARVRVVLRAFFRKAKMDAGCWLLRIKKDKSKNTSRLVGRKNLKMPLFVSQNAHQMHIKCPFFRLFCLFAMIGQSLKLYEIS